MAPKKKETQKLSLGEFLGNDSFGGSWADEVEETVGTQPLPPIERRGNGGYYSQSSNDRGSGSGGYSRIDSVPQRIPDKPPYLAHLGNLDYEIAEEDIRDLLDGCGVTDIRLIEDRELNRPKGFGYAEFETVEGLKKALTLDGSQFRKRNIRVKIAEPPKDRERGGESSRDLSEWTRKGPLPDLPRGNDRRSGPDFSERRAPRDGPSAEDKPARDFTWERKGPLSPLAQQERPAADHARDSSRTRSNDGRSESFRGGRTATWGEGRPEGAAGAGANGPRAGPPRREFVAPERMERVPSAADRDMQWRSNMRPDGPTAKSPAPSRSGSEAPPSPAASVAVPAMRPKLNLAKRTVSGAPADGSSPVAASATLAGATAAAPSASGDSKASPFGAARPIDTAAREREVEEKRQQALKDKKEADEKAKEEQRKAKEAAAQEAAAAKLAEEAAKKEAAAAAAAKKEEAAKEAETAAAAAAAAPAAAEAESKSADAAKAEGVPDAAAAGETAKPGPQNGTAAAGQKPPLRTREPREPREPRADQLQNAKSRANDSGNWRQPSGDQRGPRGPPGGAGRGRGGGGGARGGAGPRPPRANGAQGGQAPQPPTPKTATAEESGPKGPDEEGWETVPNKGRRSQKTRP